MIYGFHSAPTDVDLEALSIIETEILAYSWRIIDGIRYEWNISSIIPEIDGKMKFCLYRIFLSRIFF